MVEAKKIAPEAFRALGQSDFEVRNFVDGRRSILDIRNAVSAEYEPLTVKAVEDYLRLLETLGYVTIVKK